MVGLELVCALRSALPSEAERGDAPLSFAGSPPTQSSVLALVSACLVQLSHDAWPWATYSKPRFTNLEFSIAMPALCHGPVVLTSRGRSGEG